MKLGFYPKLAWTGMRSNRKLYLPYLITCISMVAMHRICCDFPGHHGKISVADSQNQCDQSDEKRKCR